MSHTIERANFGSRLGVILATAGSAVGLGNVWRFPYMTGQNGGAAFILIYLGCVLLLGIPCMLSEFIIGRHGAANTSRVYSNTTLDHNAQLAQRGLAAHWLAFRRLFPRFIGLLGILTGFLITSYYAVVSGWCLQYIYASAAGQLQGDAAYVTQYFQEFSTSPLRPVFWTVAILLITHLVICRGVRGGIERASKLLMPTLFLLLLVIVVASCLLPGAREGIEFLFKPDFSRVDSGVFLGALGQSFYSLSIGMGCLATYASYYSRQTNLLSSAVQISLVDSLIAILAGLMIFPAAFSVGVSPDSGASLVFITLPNVFNQAFAAMPALGYVVALFFYALLSLAALTSLMSLHEVSTAFFHEEFHLTRSRAALIVTVLCSIIGACCSLSLGAVEGITLFGRPLFDVFDFVTGQIFLPVGGFLTCLFLGWMVPRRLVRDEFTNEGTVWTHSWIFTTFLFLIRYVCPLAIAAIFLHQLEII
ncbi:MAG: sodium-dependent transporter [Prevotella sp.]|nr:sodium-dependent transporter [Prevotella sp.]